MHMEKNKIIIILVVILIAVIGIGVYMLSTGGSGSIGLNLDTAGKTVIKIHSDNNVSGKAKIYLFPDVKQNSNGTYNLSQFGDYYGLLGWYSSQTGAENDIMIQNGEATYEVPSDTKVFLVYPYITDVSGNGNITVELFVNGAQKFSSSSKIYYNQADIHWGNKLICLNGAVVPENKLIPDTAHNKFVKNSTKYYTF